MSMNYNWSFCFTARSDAGWTLTSSEQRSDIYQHTLVEDDYLYSRTNPGSCAVFHLCESWKEWIWTSRESNVGELRCLWWNGNQWPHSDLTVTSQASMVRPGGVTTPFERRRNANVMILWFVRAHEPDLQSVYWTWRSLNQTHWFQFTDSLTQTHRW